MRRRLPQRPQVKRSGAGHRLPRGSGELGRGDLTRANSVRRHWWRTSRSPPPHTFPPHTCTCPAFTPLVSPLSVPRLCRGAGFRLSALRVCSFLSHFSFCSYSSVLDQRMGAVAVPLLGGAADHAGGTTLTWPWWRAQLPFRGESGGTVGKPATAARGAEDDGRPTPRGFLHVDGRQGTGGGPSPNPPLWQDE